MVLIASEKIQYDTYLRSEAIKLLEECKKIPQGYRDMEFVTVPVKDIDEEYLKTTNASPILPRYVYEMMPFGITDNVEGCDEIFQIRFFTCIECSALNDRENGSISFFTSEWVSDVYLDYALEMLRSWGKNGEF